MCRALAPAIRSDRVPPRFDTGESLETSDELAIGQPWRHLAGHDPLSSAVLVALGEVPRQALVDGPRAKDHQVVFEIQPVRDIRDESLEVFEPAWLAGGLRAPAAPMTDVRLMPDVAGRPAVRRHV